MKHRFLISALVFLSAYTFSFASVFQDSLPSLNPAYNGYRLDITDITAEQISGWIIFQYTAINTGREDIELNENITNSSIVINFDQLYSNSLVETNKNLFTKSLFGSGLIIKAGEILSDREVKIKVDNSDHELSTNEENILPAEVAQLQENDFSTTSTNAKGVAETIHDENLCSDLIIESVSIVKKSNNAVTLKYKIKNQGKEPVSIIGHSKSEEDNLAITFHMSSSEKLTRGAIPIGGTFVKNGKQIPDGKLYPGKSLTDEIKLDIRNMTRFTPIIILRIDPYLSVEECNETNNLNHIKVQ